MTLVQDGEVHHDVVTKVWGTDVNVMDIRSQFTQFIKGFREQIDTNPAGDPVLAEEAKYYAYLKLVRTYASLPCA